MWTRHCCTEVENTYARVVAAFGEPYEGDAEYKEYIFDRELIGEWFLQFKDSGHQVMIWGFLDDLTILCDDKHPDPRYHRREDDRENMHPWKISSNNWETLERVEAMLQS